MSHNLSQPEEVELVLKDMAEHDIPAAMPDTKRNSMPQEIWPSGYYVSAYRAAHIKSATMHTTLNDRCPCVELSE